MPFSSTHPCQFLIRRPILTRSLPTLFDAPPPSAIAAIATAIITIIPFTKTSITPSPSVLIFPPPHFRRPIIAPEGGCDRLVVRDIDEVRELGVPSAAENTPNPGDGASGGLLEMSRRDSRGVRHVFRFNSLFRLTHARGSLYYCYTSHESCVKDEVTLWEMASRNAWFALCTENDMAWYPIPHKNHLGI